MASLTVWKFDTPNGAEQALEMLEGLAKQQLIQSNLSAEQEEKLKEEFGNE